ncbi:hypothetical protein WMY93_001423 [Mugilogobius chulae]|uniref:Methyltransferase type 11 domain-containing protein n=1 Tax=Mugilogobius chulae TaxID=88201 RepID=A0AAW0QC46_9GOBI
MYQCNELQVQGLSQNDLAADGRSPALLSRCLFDVVVEKATLDALMVEEKSPWSMSQQTATFIHQALTEISRCLRPGGRFISITFACPFFRKRLYARTEYNWSIKNYNYGDGFQYYMYVLTKGEPLSAEDAALERQVIEDPTPYSHTSKKEVPEEDYLFSIDI